MGRRRRNRMTLHVASLAHEHDITIRWTGHRWDAEAFPELRQAIVPEIITVGDYLLSLHELGHVLAPEARELDTRTDPYACVVAEGAAWAWAVSNAEPEFVILATDEDWGTVAEAIGSHFRWAAMTPTRPVPES